MAEGDGVTRFVKEYPQAADPQQACARSSNRHMRRLDGDRPPKKYRELFHMVNAIVQDHDKVQSMNDIDAIAFASGSYRRATAPRQASIPTKAFPHWRNGSPRPS